MTFQTIIADNFSQANIDQVHRIGIDEFNQLLGQVGRILKPLGVSYQDDWETIQSCIEGLENDNVLTAVAKVHRYREGIEPYQSQVNLTQAIALMGLTAGPPDLSDKSRKRSVFRHGEQTPENLLVRGDSAELWVYFGRYGHYLIGKELERKMIKAYDEEHGAGSFERERYSAKQCSSPAHRKASKDYRKFSAIKRFHCLIEAISPLG